MDKNIIKNIKKEFPIFKKKKKLCYLDSAAITQVHENVIKEINYFYTEINSNVHRSAYNISEIATQKYEKTRKKIAFFINSDEEECVFVKNTTEAINLIANSYLYPKLNDNDEIIISQMEHHSNIVPWYILKKKKNIKLKIIPINNDGDLIYDELEKNITKKTKFISITHISNALGTINEIKKIIEIANSKNIPILIDGAQSLTNCKINVKELNCDFFVFSSHKIYGPNGLGILYAKKNHLNEMEPYQGGGEMIKKVSFDEIIWNNIPYKFEAGTQPIASIIGLEKAIEFLDKINTTELIEYKKNLIDYSLNKLNKIKNVQIIGNPKNRANIISFNIKNIHAHDFGTVANHFGVCVRTGHHCAMPLMNFYNLSSTIRLSIGIYNTEKDINKLINCIIKAKKIFN